MIDAIFLDIAQRHHLDQCQIMALRMRPSDNFGQFVLVHTLHRDRVELDLEPRLFRRCDPL